MRECFELDINLKELFEVGQGCRGITLHRQWRSVMPLQIPKVGILSRWHRAMQTYVCCASVLDKDSPINTIDKHQVGGSEMDKEEKYHWV